MVSIKLSTSNTELIKEVVKYVTNVELFTIDEVNEVIQYDGSITVNTSDNVDMLLDMIEFYIKHNKPTNVGEFEMLYNTLKQYENSVMVFDSTEEALECGLITDDTLAHILEVDCKKDTPFYIHLHLLDFGDMPIEDVLKLPNVYDIDELGINPNGSLHTILNLNPLQCDLLFDYVRCLNSEKNDVKLYNYIINLYHNASRLMLYCRETKQNAFIVADSVLDLIMKNLPETVEDEEMANIDYEDDFDTYDETISIYPSEENMNALQSVIGFNDLNVKEDECLVINVKKVKKQF